MVPAPTPTISTRDSAEFARSAVRTTGSSVTSPVSPVASGGGEHLGQVDTEVVGQLGRTRSEHRPVVPCQHRDGDDADPDEPRGGDVSEGELGRGDLGRERHGSTRR